MSLAKWLAKLTAEAPAEAARVKSIYQKVLKSQAARDTASELDKMAGLSHRAPYSHQWLGQPEQENARNVINKEWAHVDPDVDKDLMMLRSQHRGDIDWENELKENFGDPRGEVGSGHESDLMKYLYRDPDLAAKELSRAEPPDANFNQYGERRRKRD